MATIMLNNRNILIWCGVLPNVHSIYRPSNVNKSGKQYFGYTLFAVCNAKWILHTYIILSAIYDSSMILFLCYIRLWQARIDNRKTSPSNCIVWKCLNVNMKTSCKQLQHNLDTCLSHLFISNSTHNNLAFPRYKRRYDPLLNMGPCMCKEQHRRRHRNVCLRSQAALEKWRGQGKICNETRGHK